MAKSLGVDLFVEDAADFMCLSWINEFPNVIRECTTTAEFDDCSRKWDRVVEMLSQLEAALKHVALLLRKEALRCQKKTSKEEDARKAKAKEEAQKQHEEVIAKAAQELEIMKSGR